MHNLPIFLSMLLVVPALAGCAEPSFPEPEPPFWQRILDPVSEPHLQWVTFVDEDLEFFPEPTARAADIVVQTSGRASIELGGPVAFDAERRNWTAEELRRLAAELDDESTGGLRLTVLFVQGNFWSSYGVQALGVYLGEGVVAVFPERYRGQTGPISVSTTEGLDDLAFEVTLLLHEVGHAFGLVNCDLPMREHRHDDEIPCHTTHAGEVMYAGVEFLGVREWLVERRPYPDDYSDSDKADIRAWQEAQGVYQGQFD